MKIVDVSRGGQAELGGLIVDVSCGGQEYVRWVWGGQDKLCVVGWRIVGGGCELGSGGHAELCVVGRWDG